MQEKEVLTIVGSIVGSSPFAAWVTWKLGRKAQARKEALEEAQEKIKQAEQARLDALAERDGKRKDFEVIIGTLEKRLGAQEASIVRLESKTERMQEQIDVLREEKHDLLAQIAALEAFKAAEARRADAAEEKVTQCNTELCDLRQAVGNKDAQIKNLTAQIKEVVKETKP